MAALIETVFTKIDNDKSGEISWPEMEAVFKKLDADSKWTYLTQTGLGVQSHIPKQTGQVWQVYGPGVRVEQELVGPATENSMQESTGGSIPSRFLPWAIFWTLLRRFFLPWDLF